MVFDSFNSTVELAINRYLHWFHNLDIVTLLEANLFPEKLIYERRWAEHAIPILFDVFEFLNENGILEKEGGTITFSQKGLRYLNNLDKDSINEKNPVSIFLNEGVEKLTKLLNHDQNEFDIDKDYFLLENAITHPFRLKTVSILKNFYREKINIDRPPQVAIIGNFIEWFLPSIVDMVETPSQVHLFVPSNQAIDRGISFAELDERTAVFSTNFISYENLPQTKYDLIFHFFAFGFDIDPLTLKEHILKRLNQNSVLIGVLPFGPRRCGIEPLFPLINSWKGSIPLDKFKVGLIEEPSEEFLTVYRFP